MEENKGEFSGEKKKKSPFMCRKRKIFNFKFESQEIVCILTGLMIVEKQFDNHKLKIGDV